jgi:plasmid stabilization system protein ParE
MIFRVEYSERAAYDLADIVRYISDVLYNQQAAERFFNAVNEKFGLLIQRPGYVELLE